MKQTALILLLAAASIAAPAQTPSKPAAPAATVHHTAPAASAVKLPPGVPPAKGIVKSAFTLRYQDIKLGAGADAAPNKFYKVQYTGYLGADGRKFDSSYDHPGQPVLDKDGKPEMGPDGKPKLGDPQPLGFPQGMGRLIPGFDQGFDGMKVGGKRRLFIPWQMAYGARGRPGPDAAHPGIPPKADLIFDIELVDVSEPPAPPTRPGMGAPGGMPRRPMPPGAAPNPSTPGTPAGTPPAGVAPATAPATAPAKAPVPVAPPSTPLPAPPPASTTPQPPPAGSASATPQAH